MTDSPPTHHSSTPAHAEDHSHAHHAGPGHTPTPKPKMAPFVIVAGILVLAVVGFALFYPKAPVVSNTEGLTNATTTLPPSSDSTKLITNNDQLKNQLSKAKYLKEVFAIHRDEYNLFETAAKYRGETLDETKAFFLNCCNLTSEADIFSELPPIPSDFPDVAYDLQTGHLFQIGQLGPEYYKQPEFYFNASETGLINREIALGAYEKPQLQYWGDNGLTAYPNEQYATISKSHGGTFTAAVFIANGWNIQNYEGVQLVPNSEAAKKFTFHISEDQTGQPYFLLGPTFPRFQKDWSTKVVVEGTVNPDTPTGVYTIGLNPVDPPKQLSEKWSTEHKGVYSTFGSIRPSGDYISFVITVTE